MMGVIGLVRVYTTGSPAEFTLTCSFGGYVMVAQPPQTLLSTRRANA